MNKFPEYIMRRCRERLWLEPDDISRDDEINKYSARQAVEEFLEWEGILGWTDTIIELIEDCYSTTLVKEDED